MRTTKVTEYPKIETSEHYEKAEQCVRELGTIGMLTVSQRKIRAELLVGIYAYKRDNGLLGLVCDES